jgi:hypothetical protein
MGTAIGFCKEVLSGFEVDEMGRSWLNWAQVAALRVYRCDHGRKVIWMRIAVDREGNVDGIAAEVEIEVTVSPAGECQDYLFQYPIPQITPNVLN